MEQVGSNQLEYHIMIKGLIMEEIIFLYIEFNSTSFLSFPAEKVSWLRSSQFQIQDSFISVKRGVKMYLRYTKVSLNSKTP